MKSNPRPATSGQHAGLPANLPPVPAAERPSFLTLDALPGMVYLARPDHDRTLEFVSAGVRDVLGFEPDRKPFCLAPLVHPDDRAEVLAAISAALGANQPFALEYRLRDSRGAWRTVWDQGRPTGGAPNAAVPGHLLDVTCRTQREKARLDAEVRLLQAQKFEALNQLAAGVAHEFNNLIAGILGSAELLAMDLPESHPSHESLKQIFEASNSAREFVHKLRELGQRPPPDFKVIRLQPVIEECVQILRTIIPPKVELELQTDPDCPRVNADAAQIHQAVLDLCLHSWQGLADRKGRIRITLARCDDALVSRSVPNLQTGPQVRLTVQDDSPGLEKSAREHIFHPFRNRRTGGKKVGLELFLVREIVHSHQGEIVLESELGRGLTFHVYLPVACER